MTSCAELQPLFDANPRAQEFAALVDGHSPDCACEQSAVSAQSRNVPVRDDELLVRIVLRSDVKDADLPRFEDTVMLSVIGSGLSVLREAQATAQEIRALANELAQNGARSRPSNEIVEVAGVIRFPVSAARSRVLAMAPDQIRRLFCVYETPEQGFPSHADILLTANNFPTKRKRKMQAFDFLDSISNLFIRAADYDKADLSGIKYKGQGTISCL